VFVREVIQNAKDQKRPDVAKAKVHFRLIRLHGSSLKAFLSALDWPTIKKHLDSAAETSTHASFLKQSIKSMEEDGELLLLRIDDSGTKGLQGGDLDLDKPFASLCIDELFSAKDSAGAGGSYGLGKSVLWRFSALSTVFFSSYLSDPEPNQEGLRLFGRTQLPWHQIGSDSFDGPCWFGKHKKASNVALSYWGAEGESLAKRIYLARPETPGTSILIVGFRPPAEESVHPKKLCETFCSSASAHFWPVLFGDSPELEVSSDLVDGETGNIESSCKAEITDEVKPYVSCLHKYRTGSTTSELVESEDVAEVLIDVKIPAGHDGGAPIDGKVALCVRLTGKAKVRANRVSYSRGFGMVVRYRDLEGISLSAQPFVATLLCGTLRGDSAEDRAVEKFLRLAEPPEHDTWAPNQRLQSHYKKGYAKLLEQLNRDVENNIKRLVSTATVEGEAGPELLSRMFPIGTLGKEKRSHPFQVIRPKATFSGGAWLFSGEVKRVRGDGPWAIRVALRFGTDDGAEGSVVGSILETKPVSAAAISGGVATIQVASNVEKVIFRGSSDARMHPVDARRAAVRLDVMAGAVDETTLSEQVLARSTNG
jgi:hypothetical protein